MRQLRVLQMIDSLNAGGSEMVAVNLANELSKHEAVVSFLIASRAGGMLEKRIAPAVRYNILDKKSSFDPRALWRLYRFLKKEKIDIIHSHSSSFYFPVLLKRFFSYKLVWHDHYGRQINLQTGKRENPIKMFAPYFDHTFVVNKHLLESNKKFFKIPVEKISYLANFSTTQTSGANGNRTLAEFKGNKFDRVVCLANLRPQKDHHNLLRAFKMVLTLRPGTYLYLVGKGDGDAYQKSIEEAIVENGMQKNVIWLGSQTYPAEILNHCSIGVLSSESEGLPLAVIEYGLSGLAVVSTAVGEVPAMLTDGKDAMLVPAANAEALAAALLKVLNNQELANRLRQNIAALVTKTYSANGVMSQVTEVYNKLTGRNA